MSPFDPHPRESRPPGGRKPAEGPPPAEEPEVPEDDRLAGFFDETVRDPASGPGSPGDNDLFILRNMTDEFSDAQARDEERRRREAAEAERRAAEARAAEQERKAREEQEAREAQPAAEAKEAETARGEESARVAFIEPDLSPAPPPTPGQEILATAAAAAKARRPAPRKRRRRRGPQPPPASTLALAAGGALFVLATGLAAARVEPFHTWYYVFAWYPFLMAINHLTAMRSPEHSVFAGRGRALAAMLAWSVPAWLVFEALNFRLENWYYIGVPRELLWRRLGVIVSFATVLPGVLLLEEALRVRGVLDKVRTRTFAWRDGWDRIVLGVGAAWTVLVLALPQFFFPLVWGIPVLLLEPWLRRGDGPSLARDLSEGRPARAMRLLLAGMACGLWWEAANTIAGGKWIYTVPGLDALRPFEMPLFGFIGFAPFALCLWAMARALVRLELLPDWERVEPKRAEAEGEASTEAAADGDAAPGDAPATIPAAAVSGILAEPSDLAGLDDSVDPDDIADEDRPPVPAGAPAPAARAAAAAGRFLRSRRGAIALAAAFSLIVLTLMDRWTVDSFTARAADVPGVPDGIPQYAREHGLDHVRGVLHLIREGAFYVPGESNERMLEELENACRLSLLHGIGTDNARRLTAAGTGSVEELAASDARELTARLRELEEKGWRPRPRRVAEWIRAAQSEEPAATQ
jgi:hypothetical protein